MDTPIEGGNHHTGDRGATRQQPGPATPVDRAVTATRTDRALYLEHQATRILHRAQRRVQQGCADLGEIADFLGELLIEIRSLEIQQRHLHHDLDRTRQSSSDLLQRIPVACIVTDESGRVRNINRMARQILNTSARGAVDHSIVLFFADREEPRLLLRRLALGEPQVRWTGVVQPIERRQQRCTVVIQPTTLDARTDWRWFFLIGDPIEPSDDDPGADVANGAATAAASS